MQTGEEIRSELVYFGEASWHPSARLLTVRGEAVKLPWRVTSCLSLLIEARGAVVPKEQMQREIWGDSIVEDSNLAKCINGARKALDPAPGGGSYIETVARAGYRLAVPFQSGPAAEIRTEGRHRAGRRILAGVSVALLAALGVGAVVVASRAEKQRKARELAEEGLVLLRRGNYPDGARAMTLIHRALDHEPEFALAQAALAEGVARFGESSFATASELARKAVEKDPRCGQCQGILGFVQYTRERKWREAGQRLERAVELEPGDVQLRLWYTNWLATQNRLEDAARQAEEAIRLAPSSARARSGRAMIHFLQGDYLGSIQACRDAVELDPRHTAGYQWMARAYMMMGDDGGAMSAHSQEVSAWGGWSLQEEAKFSATQRAIYDRSGRGGVAKAWIDEVSAPESIEVQRYNRAVWFMWMGAHEAALGELEAAVRSRVYHMIYVAVDPAFAPLRANPRFAQVVRGVGLGG